MVLAGVLSIRPSGGDTSQARRMTAALVAGYAGETEASPTARPAPKAPEPVATLAPRPIAAADVDCLAAAVYYEARGETLAGQAAVAQVVLNRARHPAFPKSVCAVVYQGVGHAGCQFSFACNGVMKRARDAAAWTAAHEVAARALGGYVMPIVGEATAFHVAGARRQSGVRLGGHVFYIATAPSRAATALRPTDKAQAMVPALTVGADASMAQPETLAEK
jgi:spore germination cell wall hydrolase CwlJ-like protein